MIRSIFAGYRPMKIRQILWTFIIVLFAITGLGLVILMLINRHVAQIGRNNFQTAPDEPFDCILVPGAPCLPDGRPDQMLRDRLDSALEMWRSSQADTILVSGDNSQEISPETAVMTSYLVANGVPPAAIIEDQAGFDTYQTIARAKSVFGINQALVTTQTYHLVRLSYISQSLKILVKCIPCDRRIYQNRIFHRLREVVARSKAFFECLFKPAPLVLTRDMTVRDTQSEL